MLDGWQGVPVNTVLPPYDPAHLPDIPFVPHSVSLVLGLAGRLLKYQQSLSIALPLPHPDVLTVLLIYVHQLRLNALTGLIRAPWLNAAVAHTRTDVLLLCQPRVRLTQLSRYPYLRATILDPRHPPPKTTVGSGKGITWLLDARTDVTALLDLVTDHTAPFVIVIDGTAESRLDVRLLDEVFSDAMPEVPRLILQSLGDTPNWQAVQYSRSGTHRTALRLLDAFRIDQPGRAVPAWFLVDIPDQHANGALSGIFSAYLALRQEERVNRDPVLARKLNMLGKVMRAFNELVVPLTELELQLQASTRPGLYAVRTLARWLDVSRSETCRYGSTDTQVNELRQALVDFHQLLGLAVTGKTQYIEQSVKSAVATRSRLVILVGGSAMASVLEHWLDTQNLDWRDWVTLQSMDGLRAYRARADRADRLLVTAPLWPSRQHWLAFDCPRVYFLCYPYERPPIEAMAERWRSQFGASLDEGDKLALWQLHFDRPLRDILAVPPTTPIEVIAASTPGQYPKAASAVALPGFVEAPDWLEQFLADPVEPTTSAEDADLGAGRADLAWIAVEEENAPIPWPIKRSVLVLLDQAIDAVLPLQLAPGQQILLLPQSDERLATHEQLFSLFAEESEQLNQLLKWAEKWQWLVDRVAASMTRKAIMQHLNRAGVSIHAVTLANWLSHGVLGPQDDTAVEIFATLAAMTQPRKAATRIAKAIKEIRTHHQQLGKQIRQAIVARANGASEVRFGRHTFDGRHFDAMISLRTVVAVRVGKTPGSGRTAK